MTEAHKPKAAPVAWGPVVMASDEFEDFEKRLMEPPKPTPAILEGQAMLLDWVEAKQRKAETT